jgi:hypothetical protein
VRLRDEGKRKDVLAGKAIRQIKSQMSQLNRPEVKALLERLEAADRERQAAGSGAGGRARAPPPRPRRSPTPSWSVCVDCDRLYYYVNDSQSYELVCVVWGAARAPHMGGRRW